VGKKKKNPRQARMTHMFGLEAPATRCHSDRSSATPSIQADFGIDAGPGRHAPLRPSCGIILQSLRNLTHYRCCKE